MKTCSLTLLLGVLLFGCDLSARAEEVVRLATPFSPPCVSITNDLSYHVRVYAVEHGRRFFMAELTSGEHLDRRMPPPVSSRHWLVTTTGDEELGRFTLTTAAHCVVLR
ncbi:MAG: hypothetical protein JO295_10250 [Verrucomicrobia bacterium]|nr:hypothetical protein [Verrucomicrobiota bacterium]